VPHADHATSPFLAAPTLAVLFIACVYVRGWVAERSKGANVAAWRACSFLVGLLLIWVAVGSPLAALDHEWLTVHMIHHLLLMTLAPPLLWLGAPAATLRLRALSRPTVCWVVATVVLVGWHVPAVFTLGMQSPVWHGIERASFLAGGLLFWLPVVRADSDPSTEARWSIIIYLFLATLPCDILAGFLVFSERVAYPIYFVTSQRTTASVLTDQECAGAVMWTCVTIVYLAVGGILTTQWLAMPQGRASAPLRDVRTVEVL
jgi:putative membrane protein